MLTRLSCHYHSYQEKFQNPTHHLGDQVEPSARNETTEETYTVSAQAGEGTEKEKKGKRGKQLGDDLEGNISAQ